jgi:hypothetical protein
VCWCCVKFCGCGRLAASEKKVACRKSSPPKRLQYLQLHHQQSTLASPHSLILPYSTPSPSNSLHSPSFGFLTLPSAKDTMRPLTETETQTLFAKLANYTGTSLKNVIAPLDNGPNADRFVFRLHQSRCYYVRLSIANMATSISRDKLLSLGTCLGMFFFRAVQEQYLTGLQASLQRLENFVFTSRLFPFYLNTHVIRSG